ncbi:MAG: glycosyltransferase [Planctomycetota bacterium]
MRIGILHNAYRYRGGEDRVAEAEARLLASAGHHVSRLCFDNQIEFAELGPKLLNLARSATGWNSHAASRVQEWIRSERLDIVHTHNLFPLITAAGPDAIRAMRVPIVATLHNYRAFCASGTLTRNGLACDECVTRGPMPALIHGCWAGSRMRTASWMLAQRRARPLWEHDRVTLIAPTDHVHDRYREAGFTQSRIVVRPHFSDIVPRPNPERRGAVVIGRVERSKGVLDLLTAWPANAGPLTVVGDGPDIDEARMLAGGNTRFTGPLDAGGVARELGCAKVLLSASLMPETFGLTLIEAAASGAVAAAFRNGGSSSVIVPDRTGILVERGDFAGLVESALRLMDDNSERGHIASRAKQRFDDRYSSRAGLASLETIYRASLGIAEAAA